MQWIWCRWYSEQVLMKLGSWEKKDCIFRIFFGYPENKREGKRKLKRKRSFQAAAFGKARYHSSCLDFESSNVTGNQTSSPSSQSQNAQTHVNKQQRLDTDLQNLWHGTMANITFSHISSNSLLHFINPFPPLLPTNLSISRHSLHLHPRPHQLHRRWQCSTFCCWIHRLRDSTVCCLFVFRGRELLL